MYTYILSHFVRNFKCFGKISAYKLCRTFNVNYVQYDDKKSQRNFKLFLFYFISFYVIIYKANIYKEIYVKMQKNFDSLRGILIVTGHYGSGKTNLAVNLAKNAAKAGKSVTLVDLDIVNPYFRAADNTAELEALGVKCVSPQFANTNVDIPTLTPAVYGALELHATEPERLTILDVGGDNGAVALGLYGRFFERFGYELWYAASLYRPLTETPEDAMLSLHEVEDCSRLKVTGIVNTSSLGEETTAETVLASLGYADRLAELAKAPLVCTVADRRLENELSEVENLFPIDIATKRLY